MFYVDSVKLNFVFRDYPIHNIYFYTSESHPYNKGRFSDFLLFDVSIEFSLRKPA